MKNEIAKNEIAMSSKLKTVAAAGLACAFVTLSPFPLPMQAYAQFGGGSQYGGDSQGDPQMEIDRLSDQLRKLTGQNEELQHRNQILEEQLRQLQGGAAPGAAGAPARAPANAGPAPYQNQNQQYQNQPAQNPQYQQPQQPAYQGQQGAPITTPYNDGQVAPPAGGRHGDAFDPRQNPNAPGAPRALGSMRGQSNYAEPGSSQPGAPMSLESNNGVAAAPPPNAGGGLTTAPPTRSPKDEFDLGLGYMQHKDYGLAEEAMRNFTVKYPSDRLVGDAQYWLGESLYQRKKYREAAEAFLTVTSKYDKSSKAPDAMLRLGESLSALKEKDAACAAFGEVARKYPHASKSVKQSVARGQKRSGC